MKFCAFSHNELHSVMTIKYLFFMVNVFNEPWQS